MTCWIDFPIVNEAGEWKCRDCGNVAENYGFYPCDSEGKYVEPVEGVWDGKTWRCDRCNGVFREEK